jgi:hypothetical protein
MRADISVVTDTRIELTSQEFEESGYLEPFRCSVHEKEGYITFYLSEKQLEELQLQLFTAKIQYGVRKQIRQDKEKEEAIKNGESETKESTGQV